MEITEHPRDLARDLTSQTRLQSLHRRLATAAASEGVLDIAYRTVATPIGTLLLAGTQLGLVRVAFSNESHDDVLQTLADRVSPRILHAPARLEIAAHQLDEYFARTRTNFELQLDWQLSSGFRRKVLHCLSTHVGYGHTSSYSHLATLAGNPTAARAAAGACATNPLPIVIPCHRVIRADGADGAYLGGDHVKHALLTLERAA